MIMDVNTQPLAEEMDFFLSQKSNLMKTNKDQFALIKGRKIIGAFTTFEEAYKAGVEKLGNVPFLIKQVTEQEIVHRIPALSVCRAAV